ncbi:hypothetical protein B0A58_15750 [Flavobacterium branchiophilum NBRC 15030 = ATCC 35035]|uniref:Hydrolase n=2 Tax=Flavobacterium branchiophilum TaxID=55197 RepID=G2YZX9_FLABF|nr:hypothetical protein [Flavobacterium branchiophilum]OXA67789.1 hypothetical protein B0A58_15750 [Flavobacterium branchiophilum NBRC 15030 = ATCC 35035]PDS21693.1 hypothetical protein B0A77_15295 [Flavobacterium branchiophilum]TQM41657.1 hypothetical protein BC670_2646 [Flavobacterium branchiophilum]CCB69234.1 Probable transmembrane protein of unknown function [Flavobacterium branchiophilum FL-15]GEM56726.1 hypothetical protein FB1_29470 [Flavobacterium branchiophilum NBRC 15030 = ATCC 35035
MKRSLMLYLCITIVLLNIFTYSYYSKQVAFEQKRFAKYEKKMTDSLNVINSKLLDEGYFSLEHNQNAQDYFENQQGTKVIDYQRLIPVIRDQLLDYNKNPDGNVYTGQTTIGANKFVINKIKVLNHRWIIADYSDGAIWGEVLLKYFINDDESLSFEVAETILYPKVQP